MGTSTISLHRSRDVRTIRSREQAMVVVDAIVAQHGIDSVAAWLRELGLQTSERSADALAEALASALLDRNLVLVAQDRTPRTLDSPRVTPLRDLGPVAPVESVDHWIELQLQHETGGSEIPFAEFMEPIQ